MGDSSAGVSARGSLSLRVKIILAFFIISSFVSVALSVITFRILSDSLFTGLQDRVRNLSELGSLTLDRAAFRRLVEQVSGDLTAEQVAAVETSEDFRLVSDQLNRIRETDEEVVGYIYTFIPTEEENMALFVVDADLLPGLEARASGEEVPEEDLTHFASEFDLSEFPVARAALREARTMVETEYTYDEAYDVNSLSGYSPIFDTDGMTLLAMTGVDLFDTDARIILRRTTTLSFVVSGAALLLSMGTSIFFGYLFTRGIIQLDQVVRSFGERNLEVRVKVHSKDEVGRLGASFNQMADIIQRYSRELEALLNAYGRFVPHNFLRFLHKQSVLDVKLGDQVEEEMTILFSDIRSFTRLSESMSPQENFNFLNSYLSRVGPEIRSHDGFIDKYIGDAIMALFPKRPDDAVRAAIAIRHKLLEYNGHRHSSGYAPIEVGIGLNTGRLMLGTIGEQERMDGSVISDAVNLCSRLESLSKVYGQTILITGHTLSKLENRRAYHLRFVDRVLVRGRTVSVPVYEVFDADPPQILEAKEKARKKWSEALDHYYAGRFKNAYVLLKELKEMLPDDPVITLFLRRCVHNIRNGVPENWQGVEIIDSK
ncbi:MAG: adenylate/guanylate cyclase domain-containing protein [Spirochaetales bacterium]|nr:adenylate/guanylate cyclase domain-containing protein [Spirochaetales bacterium]